MEKLQVDSVAKDKKGRASVITELSPDAKEIALLINKIDDILEKKQWV